MAAPGPGLPVESTVTRTGNRGPSGRRQIAPGLLSYDSAAGGQRPGHRPLTMQFQPELLRIIMNQTANASDWC